MLRAHRLRTLSLGLIAIALSAAACSSSSSGPGSGSGPAAGDSTLVIANAVRVATLDGRVVQGLRVNEDSFTIQVRDADDRLHSFDKGELAETRREPEASLMPAYARKLAAGEIDDLVAYLFGLRGE